MQIEDAHLSLALNLTLTLTLPPQPLPEQLDPYPDPFPYSLPEQVQIEDAHLDGVATTFAVTQNSVLIESKMKSMQVRGRVEGFRI